MNILGINYRTTLMGLLALIAVVGKLVVAFKTKDLDSIGPLLNELLPIIAGLLLAIGLTKAKDQSVTGAGPTARDVDR